MGGLTSRPKTPHKHVKYRMYFRNGMWRCVHPNGETGFGYTMEDAWDNRSRDVIQ